MTYSVESETFYKTIELGKNKTAQLRFANLNTVKAIICRISYPITKGLIIPFDNLDISISDTTDGEPSCSCEHSNTSKPKTIELCDSCLNQIYSEIKELFKTEPEKSLAYAL